MEKYIMFMKYINYAEKVTALWDKCVVNRLN